MQPNQIPYVNPPLPSGPEALNGDAFEDITEEMVLADPTWAENQLHAALTLRAMKWLQFLKQDETINPQPGQRLVTLDTQVSMFKVISEWLKTSKKTKEAGNEDEGAPGIEQMRQIIREEMALREAAPPKKFKGVRDEDDDDEPEEPPEPPKKRMGAPPGNRYAADAAARKRAGSADDGQLKIILNRAQKAAYEDS